MSSWEGVPPFESSEEPDPDPRGDIVRVLSSAESRDHLQDVGRRCREVLIDAARLLADPRLLPEGAGILPANQSQTATPRWPSGGGCADTGRCRPEDDAAGQFVEGATQAAALRSSAR